MNVFDYILAITAKGGDHYEEYAQFDTPEYREAFEAWLVERPKVTGETLWRGYTFERGYWEDGLYAFEAGEVTVDNLTAGQDVAAFTDSPLRAVNYIREFGNGIGLDDSVRVLFKVNTGGKHCVDISRYSYYPKEREYRCIRDARFSVVEMKTRGSYIEITLNEA